MEMKTRTNQKIKNEYFNWLFRQIEERDNDDFRDFISDLHSVEFYCLIPNDDNRLEDGLQLRNRFDDSIDISEPCSILEMLIALANRMDFIMSDPEKGPRVSVWFWLFIDNLKLQKYNCSDEDSSRKRKLNKIILRKFVKREYGYDGKGGLFPLSNPRRDQRGVEIWYQMMAYIDENYNI